ncbi:uncharacterized protein BDR25DRAFT_187884, partial [Lindgomyces ingoldianus]
LEPSFRVRTNTFFKVGKVFKVLWPEVAGDVSSSTTSVNGPVFLHEPVFVKIRWFIVIREGYNCCTPLQTYHRRGVTSNKALHHHSIAFTGMHPPKPLSYEMAMGPGSGMLEPIKVQPQSSHDKLDPLTRINFMKIHTVESNVKVK